MLAEAGLALRLLRGEPDEMRALQGVIDDAPRYAQMTTGGPPGPADARTLYTILPDGKRLDDKFVFGIQRGDATVGCVDLIRGHPDASTIHIGLLLIAERYEGRGIGRAAGAELERLVRSWDCCTRLRLGVVRTNDRALRFWTPARLRADRRGQAVSEWRDRLGGRAVRQGDLSAASALASTGKRSPTDGKPRGENRHDGLRSASPNDTFNAPEHP